MGTNQGDRQAAVRALTGTAYNYEGDWHALFDLVGIASGDFNGRMLAWLNQTMGAGYPDLPGAQAAFALSQGADTWNGLGAFSTWQTPGAVLDYDFKNNRYLGPALTVSRASSAYVDDSSGNWTLVPANTLRRSDKGALIEGAQTNSIRNNSWQGAGTGSGTAPGGVFGVYPLNYAVAVDPGCSASLVALGVESGMEYADIRVQGTANLSGYPFAVRQDSNQSMAVSTGQLLTGSFFAKLVAGTIPRGTVCVSIRESDTNGAEIRRIYSAAQAINATALGKQRFPFRAPNKTIVR